MSKELREELVAFFDSLSTWRDEVEAVTERCLNKVLYRTAGGGRSLGWPYKAVKTTREHLKDASNVQTKIIDQIIEGWKRQLMSAPAPTAIPSSFTDLFAKFGSAPLNTRPEFNPLAPWAFWLQAAEMWQRTWMPDAPYQKDNRRH
jgi:hypothetical protein